MRKNIIFFDSYYEAIKELPVEQQGQVYKAIIDYAFEGIEPNLKGLAKSVFILIKPYIDSSKKKQESGSKGGKSSKKSSEDISGIESEDISEQQSKSESKHASNIILEKEEENKEKEDISKKEINKEKNTILTDSELNFLIEDEFADSDVCQKFKDYALMRKGMGKNKAIRTKGTFDGCVRDLRKYAHNKIEALEVLDNSIKKCYQGLFDIFKHTNKTPQQEAIPYAN